MILNEIILTEFKFIKKALYAKWILGWMFIRFAKHANRASNKYKNL